jgi:thiamine-phosphate pyrophosphorylase
MPAPILYYITDHHAFQGDERSQRQHLLSKIEEAARVGVDYIQLREKNLPARDLEVLAREAVNILRQTNLRTEKQERRTALLINSRTDVALAVGADGVHLPANDLGPEDIRRIWVLSGAGAGARVTISVACHTVEEVEYAANRGADLAIFAPIFEKKDAPGTRAAGIDALREACKTKIPVLPLGGVTLENATACLDAGAAGIAGIRLFQGHDIAQIVARLGR